MLVEDGMFDDVDGNDLVVNSSTEKTINPGRSREKRTEERDGVTRSNRSYITKFWFRVLPNLWWIKGTLYNHPLL